MHVSSLVPSVAVSCMPVPHSVTARFWYLIPDGSLCLRSLRSVMKLFIWSTMQAPIHWTNLSQLLHRRCSFWPSSVLHLMTKTSQASTGIAVCIVPVCTSCIICTFRQTRSYCRTNNVLELLMNPICRVILFILAYNLDEMYFKVTVNAFEQ